MSTKLRFADKVAIVTGAASGIGLATAKRLRSEGARVVLADISVEKLSQAQDELNRIEVGSSMVSRCDVSKLEDVRSTVELTIQNFGQLNVIINNAGLMIFKPLEEHTSEDWQKVLGIDLMGSFFFIQQAFIHMKQGGAIVNVSSIHAVETTPLVTSYAAAKAAILSLTRSAAIEGKAKKIRVNAVLPGAVATPMLWDNPNIKAGLETIKQNDVGSPEDIAAAITFLASDDARFIQGTSLRVDGGRLAEL